MSGTTQAIWSSGKDSSSISSSSAIPTLDNNINNSFLSDTFYRLQQQQQQQQQGQDYSVSLLYNVTEGYFTSSSLDLDTNTTTSADNVSKNLMVPSLMFFFGVFGNILALIILTVKPSKDSKATAFYHLVKALVYMDLFGIVATSPVTIVLYLNGGIMKTGGMVLCHYFSFLLMLAGNATVFTVLVMAGERFMVSKFPFQYSRFVRPMAVNLTIGLVWVYSTFIALLPIIGVSRNKPHWPETWCFFDYRSADVGGQILGYFYAINGLLAIVITIVLNITVIRHLWSMRRNRLHATFRRASSRSNSDQEGSSGGSGPDSELRMVVFLMAIIVVFTVCYAPLMVRIIMNVMLNAGKDITPGGVEDKIDLWSLRLACLNQILDPWVYIISRVTCCKSQRDSAREPLRSPSQTGGHTPPSFIRRSTVTSTVNSSPSHATSPPHCPRKERNLLARTLGAIRVIFKEKTPRKEHNSNSAPKDPETPSAPLRSSASTQITLAEKTVSSRCSSSSKLYDDGVC